MDENDLNVAINMLNLGECLIKNNQDEKAISIFEKAK